ncbi:hypothetical protein ACHAPO_009789 [Fusarium lateritium]
MDQISQSTQIRRILLPSDYMRDDSFDVGERRQLAIPAFLSLIRDAKDAASAQRTFDIKISKIDENDARDLITEILEEFPNNVLRPGEELVRIASSRRKLEQAAEKKRQAEERRKDEENRKAEDKGKDEAQEVATFDWLKNQWPGRTGPLKSDSPETTSGSTETMDEE